MSKHFHLLLALLLAGSLACGPEEIDFGPDGKPTPPSGSSDPTTGLCSPEDDGPDSDGDGFSDACECEQLGRCDQVFNPDCDGDGILDGNDNPLDCPIDADKRDDCDAACQAAIDAGVNAGAFALRNKMASSFLVGGAAVSGQKVDPYDIRFGIGLALLDANGEIDVGRAAHVAGLSTVDGDPYARTAVIDGSTCKDKGGNFYLVVAGEVTMREFDGSDEFKIPQPSRTQFEICGKIEGYSHEKAPDFTSSLEVLLLGAHIGVVNPLALRAGVSPLEGEDRTTPIRLTATPTEPATPTGCAEPVTGVLYDALKMVMKPLRAQFDDGVPIRMPDGTWGDFSGEYETDTIEKNWIRTYNDCDGASAGDYGFGGPWREKR